jgi:hypothetical protein
LTLTNEAAATTDRGLIRTEFAAADTTLQSNIDAEAARALAAEGLLADDVSELNADVLALHGRHFRASSVVGVGGDYSVAISPADAGSLQVFVNGLLKVAGDDYTVATDLNGSVTDLTVKDCEAGDDVTVMGQGYVALTS